MPNAPDEALEIIQNCVAADRFLVLPHLRKQRSRRGALWDELRLIIDSPNRVRFDGYDAAGREKWALYGYTDKRQRMALICLLDATQEGDDFVVFMTVHSWR